MGVFRTSAFVYSRSTERFELFKSQGIYIDHFTDHLSMTTNLSAKTPFEAETSIHKHR